MRVLYTQSPGCSYFLCGYRLGTSVELEFETDSELAYCRFSFCIIYIVDCLSAAFHFVKLYLLSEISITTLGFFLLKSSPHFVAHNIKS